MGWLERLGFGSSVAEPDADPEGELLVRNESAFQAQISEFWSNLTASGGFSNPTLLEKVWVANTCQQLCADAISSMPLRHVGGREPAWVSNPDPVWFPNGVSDAVFAIVWSVLGWGDAFVYVTARYADGYPSSWTVLDPSPMVVDVRNGRRVFRSGQTELDSADVIQISRDPRGVRGTSAIAAYASYTNGLLAAADLGRVMMGSGGTPNAVIKSSRKVDAEQAAAIQAAWMTATAARRGAPAVLGPDLTFEKLAFSPADLMLLDAQKFDAQVIAAAYKVPAQIVNMAIEGGLNYSTPVLALEQWWRTGLRPLAKRVSGALSGQMLPKGQGVQFDSREFLAPTYSDLVETVVKLVEKQIITVEEGRAFLAMPHEQGSAALVELMAPTSAGASPAQQPSGVIALRPTQAVNQ